jgi:hypothetical protein
MSAVGGRVRVPAIVGRKVSVAGRSRPSGPMRKQRSQGPAATAPTAGRLTICAWGRRRQTHPQRRKILCKEWKRYVLGFYKIYGKFTVNLPTRFLENRSTVITL